MIGRRWSRWTWQPDKWERLSTVAELVGPAATQVLDVGGRGSELARLLPGADVRTVNIEEPADLVIPAGPLPLPDRSSDVVTSTDVLEHIPADDRPGHVAELVRVARHRVVICFPVGSPEKDAAERQIAEVVAGYGARFDYLDEHLRYGLPRPTDVVAMITAVAPDAEVVVRFQDGIEERDAVLLDALRARFGHDPRALARVGRAWVRRPRAPLTSVVGPTNNRVYLEVTLPSA